VAIIIIIGITVGVFTYYWTESVNKLFDEEPVRVKIVKTVLTENNHILASEKNAIKDNSSNNLSDWLTYNHPKAGISFLYPRELGVEISNPDSDAEFISIRPLQENSLWPDIEIEYNLSKQEGDMKKWALEFPHDKVGDEMTISGFPTIHLINNKSEQTYAMDEYIILAKKPYVIKLSHSENNQDWNKNNLFLQGIKIQD